MESKTKYRLATLTHGAKSAIINVFNGGEDRERGEEMASEFQGKYFSITDPQGVNTVIYRINETAKELQKKYPKYTVERLVCSEEINGTNKKKTFFVDYPEPNGEDLIILSFGPQKVVVNMGFLKDDKVKISKKPIPIKFHTLYSDKAMELKDFKYTPNLKRPITIIDPETTEEVKPMVYLDKNTNEVRGRCKLKPYKSYFSFEIRDKS